MRLAIVRGTRSPVRQNYARQPIRWRPGASQHCANRQERMASAQAAGKGAMAESERERETHFPFLSHVASVGTGESIQCIISACRISPPHLSKASARLLTVAPSYSGESPHPPSPQFAIFQAVPFPAVPVPNTHRCGNPPPLALHYPHELKLNR